MGQLYSKIVSYNPFDVSLSKSSTRDRIYIYCKTDFANGSNILFTSQRYNIYSLKYTYVGWITSACELNWTEYIDNYETYSDRTLICNIHVTVNGIDIGHKYYQCIEPFKLLLYKLNKTYISEVYTKTITYCQAQDRLITYEEFSTLRERLESPKFSMEILHIIAWLKDDHYCGLHNNIVNYIITEYLD